MSKKALLVISFGTTYKEAQKAIEAIEKRLHRERPDCDFYRAFTSTMVIAKLRREGLMEVSTPEQMLEQLSKAGYEEVECQSLHVIPGMEYDKMKAQIQRFSDCFRRITIGKPMLSSEEDYRYCTHQVMDVMPALGDGEALVLMGHGTEHFANAAYSQLENMFYFQGHERVLVGTVEGFPGLDYLLKKLEQLAVKKIYLAPFMIVAGDHAQNDLAGEEEDSWKSVLESKGYLTEAILIGLGQIPGIGDLFAEHLKQAEELECSLALCES